MSQTGQKVEQAVFADVNGMDRTKLLTAEAADALIRVDLCFFLSLFVADHFNGVHRAGALTFTASDTGRCADDGTR